MGNGKEGMTQRSQRKSQKKCALIGVCLHNSCILYPLYLSPTTQTPITLIVRGSHVHVRGCVIIICLVHATSCISCRLFKLQWPFLKEVAAVERRCLLVHF